MAYNPDTVYSAVVEKINSFKRKNVESIEFLKASFTEHNGVWVKLPVVMDVIDTDGMKIENLRATAHAIVSYEGVVETISMVNESLLAHQLAFDLPEADF